MPARVGVLLLTSRFLVLGEGGVFYFWVDGWTMEGMGEAPC